MTKADPDRINSKQLTNLPNLLTIARFVMSILVFALIFASDKYPGRYCNWYLAALCVFVVAAVTDWLDGYIARKYKMETAFGRFADPFVDKILICGTFIFLLLYLPGDPYMKNGAENAYANLTGWMVVVIVGREFAISAIRTYFESRNIKFAAAGWGKRKMLLQSVTIPAILANHAFFPNSVPYRGVLTGLIWLTVAVTLVSGGIYLHRAWVLIKGEQN